MSLEVGSQIAHYSVTALIGEGGMGQVYQATDTKLNRQVALKILPDVFASDPDRLARFEREAQVLASLNHPGIAGIYGLEEQDGTKALVLELVEGPTLADRIAQGPIPVDEALPIAKQIAEALEAAHEQGVIHRDLKPANIKLRPDGTVKVLDFGLAKALDTAPGGDPNQSPTLTAAATQHGAIMGTASYMSPEQAGGRSVDRRSDMWAFGVVLLEMLTGQQVFAGDTVTDVLAEVLKSDPDLKRLPVGTPESVTRLLRRSLTKDRRKRLGDAGAARLELEDASGDHAEGLAADVAHGPRRSPVFWLIAAGVVIAIAGLSFGIGAGSSPGGDERRPVQVELSLPVDQQLVLTGFNRAVALSPDGDQLAFVGRSDQGQELYLKRTDEFTATPVPGTVGATFPFFSPDGDWLGFFAGGELRRVPTTGGNPFTISPASGLPYGATWGPDGAIVFAVAETGLQVVPADGGEPSLLTKLDTTAGDAGHVLPHYTVDGSGVFFTQLRPGEPSVALWSRDTGEWRVIAERGAGAQLLAGGQLVYARQGTLLVAPFDLSRGEIVGASLPTEDEVYTSYFIPSFAVSRTGTLVYVPASEDDQLMWVGQDGTVTPATTEQAGYEHPSVSPDGSQIAVDIGRDGNRQVWILDVQRGNRRPLTTEGVNFMPLWTPGGERVAFASLRTGRWELFWTRADGSGQAEPLLEAPYPHAFGSFAPDGRLAYYEVHPVTNRDLWTLMPGEAPEPFLVTPFNEVHPTFSPDGTWMAYASDQSGRMEVYLRPFPEREPQVQVTSEGGVGAMWGPAGDRLYFRRGLEVFTVRVDLGERSVIGTPEALFQGSYDLTAAGDPHYGASPERDRFLMVTEHSASTLRLVLDWRGQE